MRLPTIEGRPIFRTSRQDSARDDQGSRASESRFIRCITLTV